MKSKLFKWPVRVYYEDTDAGGIVYHARYLAFYERARTEMLRHYHFSQQQLLSEHVAFAVRSMTVEYFTPARLDDQLEVTSQVISMGGASLTFAQHIHHSTGKCVSQAEVRIAYIDTSLMKPIALPKSLVAEFLQ